MLTALLLTLASTGGPSIQVHVDGDGYLRLCRDGRAVYAKSVQLSNVNGKLSDPEGDVVLPTITVPDDAASFEIDLEGNFSVVRGGAKVKIGQLVLAGFSPTAVLQDKDGLLLSNEKPHLGNPGDETFGVIRTGEDKAPGALKPEPKPVVKGVQAAAPQQFVVPPQVENQLKTQAAKVPSGNTAPAPQPVPTATPTSPVQNQGIQITISQHSTVGTEHILLGDIAKIEGDPMVAQQLGNVDLGNTPPTGVKRYIDRVRVIGRLRASGFKPEDFIIIVQPNTYVEKKGQQIKNSEFVTTAVQTLVTSDAPVGAWECTEIFPDFDAPVGKLELKTDSVNGASTGTATVTIGVYVDGKRVNGRTIHLILKTQIAPVRAGAPVKVVMTAGKAQVEMPGIVINGGRMGDMITVEVRIGTPEVRTQHVGKLIAPGVIEVKL